MAGVFFIAEVGSNWTNLEDCLYSVRMAKHSQADAVKFQLFDHKSLYGFDGPELKGQLPREWIPKIYQECQKVGIEFMCTAFDVDGLRFLDPYVKSHKVASSCLTHRFLLEELNKIGKPVFLSTGASNIQEIKHAITLLDKCHVTPMYCVAAYPAITIDLRLIKVLSEETGLPCGYSDHSIDVLNVPKLAADMGAVCIEKHFNATFRSDTPDAPHSIGPTDFFVMVMTVNYKWLSPKLIPTGDEQDMVRKYRNRHMATRDISEGETLTEGVNYGLYRSKVDEAKAAHGFMNLEGRSVRVAIKQGEGIGPSDVV